MNAVATKPRKSAPKLLGTSAPAVYERPEQTHRPAVGKTAEERLANLRATLHAADEKIEAAYDAAKRGTAVDVLLHLIAHDLLCDALHPVLRNEDEAALPVTKSDLDTAHDALFPVLAALEGAMALAVGTALSATLAEAFNLLNWVQDECDSSALGALMPDAKVQPKSTPATRKTDIDWLEISTANCRVSDARIMLEMLMQEAGFCYADADASHQAQSRILLLSDAIDGHLKTAEQFFDDLVVKVQGAAS